MAIIECVPNFSEGKNPVVISAIAQAIKSVSGVALLHQDANAAANRTVFTFAGETNAVFEAAYNAIAIASELIDMRQQKGEHPRIGACDVCPFVPISGISLEQLAELCWAFGKTISHDFKLPVFFYEASARSMERRNLAHHRRGDYEQLKKRMDSKVWLADYGDFNAKSGGTVLGARNYLVAYNINLDTKDAALAQEIAYDIRALGRPMKKVSGKTIYKAGKLNNVKAIGWYIKDFDRAQVSINLTNYIETPIEKVFQTTKEIGKKYHIRVTGSELIGLIPLDCMLSAGYFFLNNARATESDAIQSCIEGLGLSEIHPFEPNKRILEYVLNERLYAGN